ncbi:RNA cytidine acetyltransferase [Chionoecetes opilio]|uniref:RNA cytidine acetyltransferase n=1 Tax=Chionoecetes opilio TaxID=41210 RepID=A0A8J5CNM0_CHIOP|nr:RNA cytidine acetyltransferase [Chionoecetes opilio]
MWRKLTTQWRFTSQLDCSARAQALLKMIDLITEKNVFGTVAVTAGRGRGKSAALGLATAAAIYVGLNNIFVTSPTPENLSTFFEFVFKVEGRVNGQGMWVFLGHSTVQKDFKWIYGSHSGSNSGLRTMAKEFVAFGAVPGLLEVLLFLCFILAVFLMNPDLPPPVKRSKKVLSLEVKRKILKRIDEGAEVKSKAAAPLGAQKPGSLRIPKGFPRAGRRVVGGVFLRVEVWGRARMSGRGSQDLLPRGGGGTGVMARITWRQQPATRTQ